MRRGGVSSLGWGDEECVTQGASESIRRLGTSNLWKNTVCENLGPDFCLFDIF